MKYFLRALIIIFLIIGIVAWKHCGDCGLDHTGAWKGGWLPHVREGYVCNWSLDFDGDSDYVHCGNDASLDITGSITLEAWVYMKANGINPRIVSKFTGAGYWGYELIFNASERRLRFQVGDNDIHQTAYADNPINLNEWYHVAGTYDAGSGDAIVYVNGAQAHVTEDYGVNAIGSSLEELRIGSWPGSQPAGSYFEGMINEVRIYSEALDSAEIAWNADNPCDIYSTTFLLAWWRMEEGSGDTTFDETANNNDGILGNGVAVQKPDWVADTP